MFDVLILTDPRFMGGTTAAIAADMRAFSQAGLSVGLYLVQSDGFFRREDQPNPAVQDLADLDGVTLCNDRATLAAGVAFFHHPGIFLHPVLNPVHVTADRSLVVTHQPLFEGNGAMNFDPLRVMANLKQQFGTVPIWAPVSGLCRQHYRSLAPVLRLSREDWGNSFDVSTWTPRREKFTRPVLTIGRHGRPHTEKWPDTAADIAACLPATATSRIRVMGADRSHLDRLGVDVSAWDLVAFNGETPQAFLDSLDVFSYFYADRWVEAYGRTVAEAMLMGCRCILPDSLRPTFGPHALYGRPQDVPSMLAHLRDHPAEARAAAARARIRIEAEVSAVHIVARLQRLRRDIGTRSRRGGGHAGSLTTLRKLIGVRRRHRPAGRPQVSPAPAPARHRSGKG